MSLERHRHTKAVRTGIILGLLYFLISSIWILGSDWLVSAYADNPADVERLQGIKGLIYVGVMSIIIGVLAYRLYISHEMEARTRFESMTDMTTGLPNNLRFQQVLSRRLQYPERSHLIFIDALGFGRINASLGRDAGDLLLFSISQRLRRQLEKEQQLFRIQSNKFAIVTAANGWADIDHVAEQLTAALRRPFRLGSNQVALDFATGIAALEPGARVSGVVDAAELALAEAKSGAPPRVVYFNEAMRIERSREFALESELRRAIEQRSLSIHVQPQFESLSGRSRRGEVLVRWEHPERGFISPGLFIPVAENTGLIEQVGEAVTEKTFELLAQMRDSGHDDVTLSINAAGHQLDSGRLIDSLVAATQRFDVPLSMLEVEVTESMALRNPETAIHFLSHLRELGATVALDDFGTGYSSLQYLLELPIDVLKIDRSFVRDLEADPKKRRFVRTILELAGDLGMHTVAEGVETASQMKMLQDLGCTYLQGFLLSRPVPPAEFIAVLDGLEKQKLAAFA